MRSMPELSVNATTLFYECTGSGSPLVLIHGLGSSGDDWAFQREEFSRRHTLILPDLRGSGRSAKPSGPYSIAQFAADLWALLDALAIESADLLGFSLGGAVAIEMALMRPAGVRRVVLCNALANYRTDTWRKWFEAHAQVALVRAIGLRRTGRLVARRLFPHDDQAPKRQRVVDVLGANERRSYLATIRALIGWSALDRLHALQASTLLVAAEHDYTPLADKRAEMRHFPQAQLVVMAGSRHGTPFDATERFNACVLDFLDRPDAALQAAAAAHHQATSAPV
jgi:pimeloyl-ACP methyl ester carboxylesterase